MPRFNLPASVRNYFKKSFIKIDGKGDDEFLLGTATPNSKLVFLQNLVDFDVTTFEGQIVIFQDLKTISFQVFFSEDDEKNVNFHTNMVTSGSRETDMIIVDVEVTTNEMINIIYNLYINNIDIFNVDGENIPYSETNFPDVKVAK